MGRKRVAEQRKPVLVYLSQAERDLVAAMMFVTKVRTRSAMMKRALISEAARMAERVEAEGKPGGRLIRDKLAAATAERKASHADGSPA